MGTFTKKEESDIDVAAEVASQEMMTEDFTPGDAAEGGELVAQGQGSLPAEQDDFDAWMEEDEDDSEVEPLYLSIGQKGKQAGLLVCDQAEEEYSSLTVALIRQHDTCKCYPVKFSKDNPLLCCSNDGINPSCEDPLCGPDAGENPCLGVWKKIDGKNVKTKPCEYGNWNGNEPPRCQEGRQNLVIEVGNETYMPYWLEIKSIGLKPLRGLENKLKISTKTSVVKRKKQGLGKAKKCMFVFDISSVEDVRDSGSSYQAAFNHVTPVYKMIENSMMVDDPELVLTEQDIEDIMTDTKNIEEALARLSYSCQDKFCEARVDSEAVAKWKSENPLG